VTCAELLELAGAYALGALEPDERAAVEAHLAEPGPHQGCPEEVGRAHVAAAELARALPEVKPDAAVWRAIEARTGATSRRRPPLIGPVGWVAVAAAAAALFFLQVELREVRRQRDAASRAQADAAAAAGERDRLRAEVEALAGATALQRDALALLARPGTRVVPLQPQPGQTARAVAVYDAAEGRALILSSSLPPLEGKSYQLWVIRGTAPPRPAGFLQPGAGGVAAGEVEPSLVQGAPPDALAVSLEPAGGSPSPTQILMVGKIAG
jgi:anti-sigma-K factor RskA